jgi:hypothetical protein
MSSWSPSLGGAYKIKLGANLRDTRPCRLPSPEGAHKTNLGGDLAADSGIALRTTEINLGGGLL